MSVASSAVPYASYDLHLHTCWSYDATNEVESYFRQARERGMRCLAITEHHNLDSLAENLPVAARYPNIRFIISAELTVHCSIGPVDLLCYGLPRQPAGKLAAVLEDYHQWQRDFGSAISRGMIAAGHDFGDDERLKLLRTYRPERAIAFQGNTHVQVERLRQHFRQMGFTTNQPESFDQLMARADELVPRPHYPAAEKVIPAVKAAGAIVVIAHPAHYFQNNDLKRMDTLRTELSLDGIECAHPKVAPELTTFYREYCCRHGLVSSGGSDSHDPSNLGLETDSEFSRSVRFGVHRGAPEWLDELLERLPVTAP